MPKKKATSPNTKTFPVRLNPVLWRIDSSQVGDRVFGHTEPYEQVTEAEFRELSKLTNVGQGGSDETEHQLIVRVEEADQASDEDATKEGSQTDG